MTLRQYDAGLRQRFPELEECVSGSLDVDYESNRITELECANAGRLGQAGAPAQDRLEVAELLDLLDDRKIGCQIAAASVARGATRAMEYDAECGRPAHRHRHAARIFDEIRRCLPRQRVRGKVGRRASLWNELEDDPVEARLMRDTHRAQLHRGSDVRTATVVEAGERTEIRSGRRERREWSRRGRGRGGCRGCNVDNEARWPAELENPDTLR